MPCCVPAANLQGTLSCPFTVSCLGANCGLVHAGDGHPDVDDGRDKDQPSHDGDGPGETLSSVPAARHRVGKPPELPPERSKALLAQLIEEVRVVSAADVRVTYRVPPEVRLPDGMVEMRGLEPLTPAMRTHAYPTLPG